MATRRSGSSVHRLLSILRLDLFLLLRSLSSIFNLALNRVELLLFLLLLHLAAILNKLLSLCIHFDIIPWVPIIRLIGELFVDQISWMLQV